MKKFTKRLILHFLILSMFGVCMSGNYITANADSRSEKHTIWVIGDSTVSAFNDNYYYPRYGYGTQIQNYIDFNLYEVKNLALSGRSSKSYVLDKEYQTLLNGMSDGDFLIIGFGHNDEKFEEGRYTNPNGTYLEDGTFANSLYENYIKKAEEKGCTPILATPIVRRTATGNWVDSELHITKSNGEYEGGDYPQAIRDLGQALDISVVDMTSLTKDLYNKLGPAETMYLHSWTSSKPASIDNTHTNIWGGKYNAYFFCKSIKELKIKGLSNAIAEDSIKEEPSKSESLFSNPDYIEPDYDSSLKDSEIWEDAGIWKGSAFGSIGATPDESCFTLAKIDEDKINMVAKDNKGKISSAADGLAMYYYKVPVNSTFTLSATATINTIVLNNQVSFGLMARDDMHIDVNNTNLNSDYVAAGPLNIAGTKAWNCFARKSGVLTKGGTASNTTFEAGNSIDLKIQSNSDGYACTMGEEQTITGGFDFALTSVDSEYVYVGMFVARNVDITFSNIKLIVDGEEVTGDITTEKPENPDDTDKPDDSEETEVIDTIVLENAIAECEKEASRVQVSLDGLDVLKEDTWVTKEVMNSLKYSINEAKGVKENAASQEAVNDSIQRLKEALNKFNSEVKNGTKDDSSSDDINPPKDDEDNSSDTEIKVPGWYEDKDGKWYVLNSDGTKKTGWYQDKDAKWYMLDKSTGEMLTGWYKDSYGKWYMLNKSTGEMIIGWYKDSYGKWYMLNKSTGVMMTGWYKDSYGKWYMLNKSTGAMMTGWYKDSDGTWYMLNKSTGVMMTGWYKDTNGKWYYLNLSGKMQKGWIKDNNKWYYLNSDGMMLSNTSIEGYKLGADGAMI